MPEKTYQFVNIDLINPSDPENSKIVTIELTANQIVTHRLRNTELWRKIVPIEESGINVKPVLTSEEELNNQRDIVTEHIKEATPQATPQDEINLLVGDYDPFLDVKFDPLLDTKLSEPETAKQFHIKSKRGRKPKK